MRKKVITPYTRRTTCWISIIKNILNTFFIFQIYFTETTYLKILTSKIQSFVSCPTTVGNPWPITLRQIRSHPSNGTSIIHFSSLILSSVLLVRFWLLLLFLCFTCLCLIHSYWNEIVFFLFSCKWIINFL